MLRGLPHHIVFLERQIAIFDRRIEENTRLFAVAPRRIVGVAGAARIGSWPSSQRPNP